MAKVVPLFTTSRLNAIVDELYPVACGRGLRVEPVHPRDHARGLQRAVQLLHERLVCGNARAVLEQMTSPHHHHHKTTTQQL